MRGVKRFLTIQVISRNSILNDQICRENITRERFLTKVKNRQKHF